MCCVPIHQGQAGKVIETGVLSGVSQENGKISYVILLSDETVDFLLTDADHKDASLYFLCHHGETVYKVGCVRCGDLLWSLLNPVKFLPHGPVCQKCVLGN